MGSMDATAVLDSTYTCYLVPTGGGVARAATAEYEKTTPTTGRSDPLTTPGDSFSTK